MSESILNILIGGEAGQGLQTVGPLFAKSLVRAGFSVNVTQTYESRIRGGHNTFAIRFGAESVRAPQEEIDILIALNEETVSLHENAVASGGRIIGNAAWDIGKDQWVGVPFEELGQEITWNTVAMGVAAGLIGLRQEVLIQVIEETFHGEGARENQRIVESSYRWLSEQSVKKMDGIPSVSQSGHRLVMNGHEAVALGAISAGMGFCAFYPMSPSTSIPQTLITWAKQMDLVVEQAEDEIAAINMALGASYAGVPSMVATSGGGYALMTESVSLAAASETPVVIVIGQRCGPATGLPTRTEQGDLWFALHGGHGEFPRAIFAPGSTEECFHLTRKAFDLAERFQGPMFVLTDHYLADSYRDMDPVDVESLSTIKPGADPGTIEGPYKRYSLTDSGISPRLLPGWSEHLVVGDSHEHTEVGHMTEDLSLRPKMVDKRLRKERGLREEIIPPEFRGDEQPDLILVGWGSSKGAVEEAASQLTSRGERVATLYFSQIWPMAPDQFLGHLEKAKTVVCVESNATGQLAGLIRRETGFLIEKRVSRYDGLAITPEYILRTLNV
jgi:2-oxoglutarate ferredoxin oxidoreductase subunit alpha